MRAFHFARQESAENDANSPYNTPQLARKGR
jgi:hypothetical protein